MQQRFLGRTGLKVSRLGLGTLTWGRDTDEHEARDQLKAFVEAGGTLLDTAAGYGDGASEELIGSLLGDVVTRDDVVLATKAGVAARAVPGAIAAVAPGGQRVPGHLLRTLDESLRRLGTDHVDLWQVHAWSDESRWEETLRRPRHRGQHRPRGVRRGLELLRLADRAGRDLAARGARPGAGGVEPGRVLPAQPRASRPRSCPPPPRLGLGVLAWSPLGRGVLTGKYRTGTPADSRAASPHFGDFVGAYLDPRCARIVEAVARAADGLQWSPLEVALAWVRDRPGVSSAIVGARTAAQLRGSLTVEECALPEELRAALDDVSARP